MCSSDLVHGIGVPGAIRGLLSLELPLDRLDGIGVEQFAQLGVAQQFLELCLVDDQGLRAAFGERGVAVVEDRRPRDDHPAAAMAKDDGCLLLGPMYRNAVVGYICIVTDPDGNNIEFSVEQVLG